MKTHLFSLINEPPAGFVTGIFGKRELLSGVVVLLAANCESAYALLPDFQTRVEGVVVTFGAPKITRAGPLLWHFSLSREALTQGNELLALVLESLAAASTARNEATVSQLAQTRLRSEHATHIKDYLQVTEIGRASCRERV